MGNTSSLPLASARADQGTPALIRSISSQRGSSRSEEEKYSGSDEFYSCEEDEALSPRGVISDAPPPFPSLAPNSTTTSPFVFPDFSPSFRTESKWNGPSYVDLTLTHSPFRSRSPSPSPPPSPTKPSRSPPRSASRSRSRSRSRPHQAPNTSSRHLHYRYQSPATSRHHSGRPSPSAPSDPTSPSSNEMHQPFPPRSPYEPTPRSPSFADNTSQSPSPSTVLLYLVFRTILISGQSWYQKSDNRYQLAEGWSSRPWLIRYATPLSGIQLIFRSGIFGTQS